MRFGGKSTNRIEEEDLCRPFWNTARALGKCAADLAEPDPSLTARQPELRNTPLGAETRNKSLVQNLE